jgi:hypothetical protein
MPDVSRRTVRLLGRHVCDGSHDGAGIGQILLPDRRHCRNSGRYVGYGFGQAEIEQFYVSVLRNENVGGLDIPMCDPLGMGLIQPIGALNGVLDDLFEWKRNTGDPLS